MKVDLFKPDNFSKSEIRYKNIDLKTQQLLEEVIKFYISGFKVVKAFQLDAAEINSNNYRVELNIQNKAKVILIRKMKLLQDETQINFFLQLSLKLKKFDVKNPSPIKTKSGKCLVNLNGEYYAAFDFIEGNHFKPVITEYESAAEEIAKMHIAFNKLGASAEKKINFYSKMATKSYFNVVKGYSISDFDELEGIIKQKNKISDTEKKILAILPDIRQTINEVSDYAEEIKKLKKNVIHCDLHPHNLIAVDNRIVAILDFDSLRISQQARDVAFAIYRLGRQFLVGMGKKEDVSKYAAKLVDLFVQKYSTIKPLTEEEIKLIPLLIKDEFLIKLLYVLREVYITGDMKWSNNIPQFVAAILELDFFWSKL